MITQKFILPVLFVLIADISAVFYFLKDNSRHENDEVDHYDYEYKPRMMHTHREYEQHYHHGYHQDDHTQVKHQTNKHHESQYPHYSYHQGDYMVKHQSNKHLQTHKHREQEYSHHGYYQGDHKQNDHQGHHEYKHHDHHHKHQGQPHYEFKYGVRDPNTGDIKNQWEMRKGDEVQGEYSLVEADGTIRTVQYTAGKHTGFNAVVKKEGKSKHPIGKVTLPIPSHVRVEADSNAKGSRLHKDKRQFHNPSNLPTNHRPVFSGIDEKTNLLALYKHYPLHSIQGKEERGFDYGINDYLTKRSYDLSKITAELNASPTVDPIRAARGSFIMG